MTCPWCGKKMRSHWDEACTDGIEENEECDD